MAANVKGVGAASAGFTAATAVALPGGAGAPASGDLIIILEESSNATLPGAPTGYTTLLQFDSVADGGTGSASTARTLISVFAKLAGASESDPTVNPGNNHASARIIVIENHGVSDVSTDIVVGTAGAVNGTSISIPGITVTADSLILACAATANDAISTAQFDSWTNSNLASITEQMDNCINTGNGGGYGMATGTCAGTSTGATTVTGAAAVDYAYVQLGIPPAAGGGGQTEPFTVAAETDTALAFTASTIGSSLSQPHFRIRSDDSQTLNADAGWAAALDTNATIDAEKIFRVRFEVEWPGTGSAKQFKLQYRRNGGTWTDVPVRNVAESTQTGTDRIEIVLSGQYANDDATTNLLSGSSQAFEAGVGLEDNLTPSITLSGEHTEYEWALRIRKLFHNGTDRGANADGDTFELRIVESGGTVFAGTYVNPTITLNADNRIGGVLAETVKRAGPFRDGNGNLYIPVEYGEPNNSDEIVMMKSTDDGVQWAPVDEAGAPTAADNNSDDYECLDIQQVGTVLHILSQNGTGRVRYHTFNTSDAGTNPDTWQITGEVVFDVGGTTPNDQDCAISVRSDGTVVAFYRTTPVTQATEERIGYKIRSSGGSWGSESSLDSTASGNFTGVAAVRGESDLTYVFYKDHNTTDLLYYKTLSSSDVLSGRTQVNAAGTIPTEKPVTQAIYLDDGGTEVITVSYRRAGATSPLYVRSIANGSLQTEQLVSDSGTGVATGLAGSGAVAAVVAATGTTIHVAWIDNADNTLLKHDSAAYGQAFGTDVTEYDSASNLYEITGNIFGSTLGIAVDEAAAGLTGGVIYKTITVVVGQTENFTVAAETDSALAFTHSKVATFGVSTETDSAQTFIADRRHVFGTAAEADAAMAFLHEKLAAYGIAVESDAAALFVAQKLVEFDVAAETDAGFPFTGSVSGEQTAPFGPALEADAALSFTHEKLASFGTALETDAAFPFSTAGEQLVTFGTALETDSGLAFVVSKLETFGTATETEAALAFLADRLVEFGVASDTEAALAFLHEKLAPFGVATETDAAQAFEHSGGAVGPPQEAFFGIAHESEHAPSFRAFRVKAFIEEAEFTFSPFMLRPFRRPYHGKSRRRR